MSKFDELIHSLKKDIQSLPSVGSVAIHADDTQPITSPTVIVATTDANNNTCTDNYTNKYIKIFVRHGMLSAEFFLFFMLLLGVVRPSFLYYREKMYIQNGRREFIKTHFSILYLVSYSILFTCILHLLIFIQRDFIKRYI